MHTRNNYWKKRKKKEACLMSCYTLKDKLISLISLRNNNYKWKIWGWSRSKKISPYLCIVCFFFFFNLPSKHLW